MFVCSAHQVQGCVCQVSVDSNSPPALLHSCTPALHLLGSPGQCNLPNKWKDQYQPTPTEWCSYWIVAGTKPAKHLPLLSPALRVVLFPVSFSLCASFFLFFSLYSGACSSRLKIKCWRMHNSHSISPTIPPLETRRGGNLWKCSNTMVHSDPCFFTALIQWLSV